MKTPELKDIIDECISIKLDKMDSRCIPKRDYAFISGIELCEYAILRGYKGLFADLFNAADSIRISNENNEFEQKVIEPVKRAQGIYY